MEKNNAKAPNCKTLCASWGMYLSLYSLHLPIIRGGFESLESVWFFSFVICMFQLMRYQRKAEFHLSGYIDEMLCVRSFQLQKVLLINQELFLEA